MKQVVEVNMRSIRSITPALLAILVLASCSRNPNVTKQRYLESGNKYFEKQRYKEASIQYRNAMRVDPRFGEAHYRMALTYLKVTPPSLSGAVKELRRALELLKGQPDYYEAMVKITEIYLSPGGAGNKSLMEDAEKYCKELLARDPKSFDGLRLTADMHYLRGMQAYRDQKADDFKSEMAGALEFYKKADASSPGDEGVSLMLARVSAYNSDNAGAESYFKAALAKNKASTETYRMYYALLWSENKKPEAEALLQEGFKENPKQFVFLIWLAEQYGLENRRDDMLKVLGQLESKSGEYSRAFLDVGDFYLRMNDGDSAVKEYRQGITKDPKNKATYEKRMVEVLMRQGKRGEASDVNAQILKDNATDADARGVAATLMLDKGDVTKATLELQRVVSQTPDNPVARYNLGRAYFLHGDVEQARQQFQKAIDLRPDYLQARIELGRLQTAHGDYDAAIRTAQDILKLDPNSAAAKLIESAALMGQKKFTDSRKTLEEMASKNPNSGDVVFQLGVVDLADGKYKNALDEFRRSYQMNPTNIRGLQGMVEAYMAQGQVDQAIQLLEAESAKAPTRMDIRLDIGNVAVRAGRYDMAIAEFQKVLASSDKKSKQAGEMNLRIGETYRRKGDYQNGVAALQAARQTLPDDERVLSTLGLSLDEAQRFPEARQVYEATLKADPNNATVLNNLAFLLTEHGGDLDQALSYAQKAKQVLPNLGEVSDTLAWIYLKKSIPDKALEMLEPLVQKFPNQATWRYHLGLALSQKGDRARAQTELTKALNASSNKAEKDQIQQALARMR